MLLKDPDDSFRAQFFMTLTLAGFLIVPGAFPKIEKLLHGSGAPSGAKADIREVTHHVPLL